MITIVSNSASIPKIEIPVRAYIIDKNISMPTAFNKDGISVPTVKAEDFEKMISSGENIGILDVREASEFSEKHIKNAVNIPRSKISDINDVMTNEGFIKIKDKEKIIVYCGGGFRSSYIARKLNDNGLKAFNLGGGILSWEKIGYPLERGQKIRNQEDPLLIGLEEAYEHYFKLFKDNVVWLDVREKDDYDLGHIEGAINYDLNKLTEALKSLPKDKEIVIYCDDATCDTSTSAAKLLINNGFKYPKIKVFKDGFNAWLEAGCPLTK
ncbi:rhodanese-like protein [Candidatus Omnitrophus magneticus]|uniref:Rhodanese-like protein n=1 Tax=Candidatus Omnitrophus magneticus TaxID=1609969 RepID=A0A0F0CQQ5_9BACT|nr:rhodanese-like protein [Candidatus Omnitrophus magneticus]